MSKVILVASGKGGTGKTFFTANIGVVLAEMGYRVLLVDMDIGFRNLDIALGMENSVVYDMADAINGTCKLKQAVVRNKKYNNLYIMSASQTRDKEQITTESIKELCDKLCSKFDYIFLDCQTGAGEGIKLAASVSHMAVIVTLPEFAAIRDADMMDRLLVEYSIKDICYIVNKVNVNYMKKGLIPNLEQIGEILRPRILGTILYDEEIYLSSNRGVAVSAKKEAIYKAIL